MILLFGGINSPTRTKVLNNFDQTNILNIFVYKCTLSHGVYAARGRERYCVS
jgi:hypothetical protein